MRIGWVFLTAALFLAAAGARANETLADIRQDLSILYVEIQKLKRELSTTGPSTIMLPPDTLDRVNAIESELQRLTAQTEELSHRLDRIASDGGNRIGDLEFRLCELEPDCDIGQLGRGTTLGGEVAAPQPQPQPSGQQTGGGELAVGEAADFDAAQKALESGDFHGAAQKFAEFRAAYPGGPLEPRALLGEGRALEGVGDTREAARRYLDVYAGYPDSDVAPEALWRLGAALGALGKVPEACVTLAEVSARYPGSAVTQDAAQARSSLGCQ